MRRVWPRPARVSRGLAGIAVLRAGSGFRWAGLAPAVDEGAAAVAFDPGDLGLAGGFGDAVRMRGLADVEGLGDAEQAVQALGGLGAAEGLAEWHAGGDAGEGTVPGGVLLAQPVHSDAATRVTGMPPLSRASWTRASWVADLDGRVAGLTGLLDRGTSGEVEPVVVTAGLRGRGAGRLLIERVAAEAAARGHEYLAIGPVARNVAAIRRFYDAAFQALRSRSSSSKLALIANRQKPSR
jgi:GNAT superfamily N-acetyltransferase